MSKVTLKVATNPVIDASASTTTDAFSLDKSLEWSLIAVKSGTDGDPTIEIEGSNDGVNWKNPYKDLVTPANPLIMTLDEAVNSAFDDIFPFEKYRIKTEPNGTTVGTLSYVLSVYKDE